mgnify:CR=1 FL=1
MKKIVWWGLFIFIISINLLNAGIVTMKDGRVLSGQIIITNDIITIKGNQGFYQFSNKDAADIKLDASDINNTGKQTNSAQQQISSAIIQTNLGTIKCLLYKKFAPETVKNFVTLAKEGFFENIIFHRVIPNFMIQTGDARFRTKPTDKKFSVKMIADEINPVSLGLDKKTVSSNNFNFPAEHLKQFGSKSLKEYYEFLGYKYSKILESKPVKRGVLAMANAGPNTNSSQFFITTNDCPWLDGKHTVFGEVVSGYDIVEKISKLQTKNDKPLNDAVILSVQIIE